MDKFETVVTIQSVFETVARLERMVLGTQLSLAAEFPAKTQI